MYSSSSSDSLPLCFMGNMNISSWQASDPAFPTVDMLLEDVSKQMASSDLSRFPRGSTTQRTGNSMRIAKPNSSSNSPRGLGRRRTVMNDAPYRRRLALIDQNMAVGEGGAYTTNDTFQPPTRSNRPVSWHPASFLPPQPIYQSTIPAQTPDTNIQYQYFDFPPTPAIYSGYTSPASAFSPVSLPYNNVGQSPYFYQQNTATIACGSNHDFVQQASASQPLLALQTCNQDPSMYSHFDWNTCGSNGFEHSTTAPPTPENFLPIQHPEPILPAEEAIDFHSLAEEDDGEEELVGMGLYDTPEPFKTSSSDVQLDNYRAMMMSSLVGTGHRRMELTVKELKLAETWTPPSDDEDEDEEEQDGEGDDELDHPHTKPSLAQDLVSKFSQVISSPSHIQVAPSSHDTDGSTWL